MDKDKLSYEPKLLFTKDDVKALKAVYGGKDNQNMTLLRRIFLPTLLDPNIPEEYMANDMWMDKDFTNIPVEEVKPIVLARQDTIKHILGSLIRLRNLANQPDESDEDKATRLKKDSVR